MSTLVEKSISFEGIPTSAGVAIGRVFLLDRRKIRVPRYHIDPKDPPNERLRLQAAIDASISQLESIRSRFSTGGHDHQAILEAHELMLQDKALVQEAYELIEQENVNAEWAVSRVMGRLRLLFNDADDPYLKERRSDIDFLAERVIRNLVGKRWDLGELETLDADAIVVAHDLSPADTALLGNYQVSGFATETGSPTSHTSIIARSMDVPAVVACNGLFQNAGDGDTVIVDGIEGRVVLRPTDEQLQAATERARAFWRTTEQFLADKNLPAKTLDGHVVRIFGNIEMPSEAKTVADRGGEGIGLYRTEFLFVHRQSPPDEETHYNTYKSILGSFHSGPITIRTMDIGGDKNFGTHNQSPEPNPALGLRGIRYSLRYPELFEAQLAGLLRAAHSREFRILLPMVSGVDELIEARDALDRVRERLVADGVPCATSIPVGSMIEIPSAVLTIDAIAQACDFLSIGSNDLMQYLLAIDRTNQRVAYLYKPLHPAMLKTIQRVIQAGKEWNRPISICGEMAGELHCAPILIGLGMEQMSMNAGSIPWVKHLIRELKLSDCQSLATSALSCTSPAQVHALVNTFLRDTIPDEYALWQAAQSNID